MLVWRQVITEEGTRKSLFLKVLCILATVFFLPVQTLLVGFVHS